MCSGRLSRPACFAVSSDLEPELRRDHDLIAERRQRFADELFVSEGAVDFGGVEERDAALDGGADQRDHLLLVHRRAIAEAHAHAAEAEGRDFQIAVSEFAFLHFKIRGCAPEFVWARED